MSDDVLITLITVGGGGTLALLGTVLAQMGQQGRLMRRVSKDAAASREQTQNSHTINLRDDIDRKHQETHNTLEAILLAIKSLTESDKVQNGRIEKLESHE